MKMVHNQGVENRDFKSEAMGARARGHRRLRTAAHCDRSAFTLIEVMIALGIFFMAMFAILGLVANALRNARALQRKTVDCGMVAAQLSLTNKLTEGMESDDFGDMYPDFEWTRDIYEVQSNHLYKVDMVVQRKSGGPVESKMSILLFRPDSPPGSLDAGGLR
jgi:type II secretion system protein I